MPCFKPGALRLVRRLGAVAGAISDPRASIGICRVQLLRGRVETLGASKIATTLLKALQLRNNLRRASSCYTVEAP